MSETPTDIIRAEAGQAFFPPMTLRDYFAAKALPECLRVAADKTPGSEKLSVLIDKAAGFAYFAADAMLKARKK